MTFNNVIVRVHTLNERSPIDVFPALESTSQLPIPVLRPTFVGALQYFAEYRNET
jgi:hypothetical protein